MKILSIFHLPLSLVTRMAKVSPNLSRLVRDALGYYRDKPTPTHDQAAYETVEAAYEAYEAQSLDQGGARRILGVRLPVELKAEYKHRAKQEGRSMTALVTDILVAYTTYLEYNIKALSIPDTNKVRRGDLRGLGQFVVKTPDGTFVKRYSHEQAAHKFANKHGYQVCKSNS